MYIYIYIYNILYKQNRSIRLPEDDADALKRVGGVLTIYKILLIFIHSFSILSDDRSKASSKTILPHSAI